MGSWVCVCTWPGDSVGSLLFGGRQLKMPSHLRSPKESVSAGK